MTTNTIWLLRAVATVSLLATSIGVQGCVGAIAANTLAATGQIAGSTLSATGHVAGAAMRGGRGDRD